MLDHFVYQDVVAKLKAARKSGYDAHASAVLGDYCKAADEHERHHRLMDEAERLDLEHLCEEWKTE